MRILGWVRGTRGLVRLWKGAAPEGSAYEVAPRESGASHCIPSGKTECEERMVDKNEMGRERGAT